MTDRNCLGLIESLELAKKTMALQDGQVFEGFDGRSGTHCARDLAAAFLSMTNMYVALRQQTGQSFTSLNSSKVN